MRCGWVCWGQSGGSGGLEGSRYRRKWNAPTNGAICPWWWTWTPNMRKETVQGVVGEWHEAGIGALVWDRAPSHRAKVVKAVGLPLIEQPPAAPELNPAERVFEELRREVEGEVHGTIEKKMAAVERELEAMAASPERVQRLTGWSWIRDA